MRLRRLTDYSADDYFAGSRFTGDPTVSELPVWHGSHAFEIRGRITLA